MESFWVKSLLIILGISLFGSYLLYNQPEKVDIIHSKEFFAGILTASAGILAIAFSLSQFAVSRISDVYSPYVVKHHNKSALTKISFFNFLILIILSGIFLGLEFENQFIHEVAVWYTITLFIFSLVFFARYFFGMIAMLNPIEFSEIIKKMAINALEKKELGEFENIMTSIGDTAIKSLKRNETRICNQYLDELYNVGIHYLENRKTLSQFIEDESFHDTTKQNPIALSLNQFERIYRIAYMGEQHDVTTKIIRISHKMLDSALILQENHANVMLFMNMGSYQSFFQRIQSITSKDNNYRIEKEVLSYTIMAIVINFLSPNKIQPIYVEQFIPKPLFEIFQIIIDNNDFESFVLMVKETTNIRLSNDPGELASMIKYDIMLDNVNSKQLEKIVYDLEFSIEIKGIWNWNRLKQIMHEFGCYQSALINNFNVDKEYIYEKIEGLKKQAWDTYVNTLTYQSIFWVGSYLLFKGQSHYGYLERLWNIAKPKEGHVTYANQPAIPLDVTWSAILLQKQGYDSFSGPNFGMYQSSEPFMYKYFGLVLLHSKSGFHLPSMHELTPYFESDDNNLIVKWLAVLSGLQSNSFIEYIKNIEEKIDLDRFFGMKDMKSKLQEQIIKLQESAQSIEKSITELRPMDNEKINEVTNAIIEKYNSDDSNDAFTNAKLVQKILPSMKPISLTTEIDKTVFQEIAAYQFMDNVYDNIVRNMKNSEKLHVIKLLQSTQIKNTRSKMQNFVTEIKNTFDNMITSGCKPEFIIMPLFMKSEYQERTRSAYGHTINVSGTDLIVIHSDSLKNSEIFLASKKCFETTYLEYPTGKIKVEINQNATDKLMTDIVCTMNQDIAIIDPLCINKITIMGFQKSKWYALITANNKKKK